MKVYFYMNGKETPVYDDRGISIDLRQLKGNERGICVTISKFLSDMGRDCMAIDEKQFFELNCTGHEYRGQLFLVESE